MNRTRDEYIQYCKDNAYKQYEFDLSCKEYSQPEKAIQNACTTMLCDLSKNPDTEKLAEAMIFFVININSENEMRRFIDGFN